MNALRLGSDGYFLRDGKRFWPVGCNYTSASCGAMIWKRWPEAEIRADLAGMQRLGFNSLRFFIHWEDFEPEPGRYDSTVEQRLRQFCHWCAEFGIYAHPSLFVGWMSGGIFWPRWKRNRNLFEDTEIVERSLAFAQRCCSLLKDCGNLLAIDAGNEMSCLPDAHQAHPEAVRDWSIELLKRIRSELPGVLVVPGNEQMMIFKDQGFRLTDPISWDFYSAHGYPVPSWNEAWMPGMRHAETQRRLPFYVKFLRAFGPVMLQEFGTIATFGVKEQRVYLARMLERAWRAGANGFLYYCWKDIQAKFHPYDKGGIEGTLGLMDAEGRVKQGVEPFIEFARDLTSGALSTPPSHGKETVALLLPQEWYARENQRNPGNNPPIQCEQYAGADSIVEELGREAVIVRSLPQDRRIPIIIPGAYLRDDEIAALVPAIKAGRRLLWWSPSFYCWGHACRELLGAEIVDFFPDHRVSFTWQGKQHSLPGYPERTMASVRCLESAQVEIQKDDHPLLLRHKLGNGEIWSLLSLCRTSAHPDHAGERAFAVELVSRFLG